MEISLIAQDIVAGSWLKLLCFVMQTEGSVSINSRTLRIASAAALMCNLFLISRTWSCCKVKYWQFLLMKDTLIALRANSLSRSIPTGTVFFVTARAEYCR